MTIRFLSARHIVIGVLAVALVATSGCGWFRSKEPYKTAPENRPLEVPPDLDTPNTDPSMRIPVLASQSAARAASAGSPAAAAGAGQFELADTIGNAWRRVGRALEQIDGVTVGSRSEALGTVEVTYQAQTFLVRLRANGGATTISAVSPDGRALSDGAAAALLGLLRTRLV